MHAAQRYALLPFLRSAVSLACGHCSCAGATAVAFIHSFTGVEGGIFSLVQGWNGSGGWMEGLSFVRDCVQSVSPSALALEEHTLQLGSICAE